MGREQMRRGGSCSPVATASPPQLLPLLLTHPPPVIPRRTCPPSEVAPLPKLLPRRSLLSRCRSPPPLLRQSSCSPAEEGDWEGKRRAAVKVAEERKINDKNEKKGEGGVQC